MSSPGGPTERSDRIVAILAAALARPENERTAWLDDACADPALRRDVDALLAACATSQRETGSRWRRVSAVFAAAAEMPDAERAAYLDTACAGDPSLRTEVDQLLRHRDGAGDFLETPAGFAVGTTALAAVGPHVAPDRLVGRSIGPYLVRGRIGGGGMGVVYLAEHTRLDKTVAIKALHPEDSCDPGRRARLLREARSAAALSHPNVVTVYGLEEQGDDLYLITEYIRGRTLRDAIASGPMPAARVFDIALAVARGLAAAHARDIVHRDLKPDNVMLPDEGGVKIVDFGLARSTATGGVPLTRADERWGTPGYMSPEQLQGLVLDFRTDQFSFGVLVHELATGRHPFEGNTPEAINANILTTPPALLSASAGSEFTHLDPIVDRCLNKDRARRYESTEALVADLERVRASSWSPAPLPEVIPPTPRFAARALARRALRRWKLGAALLAAGLAGAAFSAAVALVGEPPSWLRHAEPSFTYLTFSGRDSSPAVSPDGRLVAFASERDGRRRIWLKQVGGDGEVALTDGIDDFPRFSPDGSRILFSRVEGTEISLCAIDTVGGSVQKLLPDALYGEWSPDGTRLAFVKAGTRQDGTPVSIVGVADAEGTEPREIHSADYGLHHPRWSPDGTTLALVPVSGGTPLTTAPAPPAGAPSRIMLVGVEPPRSWTINAPAARRSVSAVAWNGSSREVVYSQAESVVAAAGSTARIVRQDTQTGDVLDTYWAPERASVLDVLGPGRVVFDTRSPRQNLQEIASDGPGGRLVRWLSRGNSTDRQPAVSRDGQRVIFSSNRTGTMAIWMMSLEDGRVARLTRPRAGSTDWDPAWADSRIVFSSNRSGNFECWIAQPDGSDARQLTRDGVNAENPSATGDGTWIAYASGNPAHPGIWKIRADGTGASQVAAGPLTLPQVSSDHGLVLYRERPFGGVVRLGVVSLDGRRVPFEIRVPVRKPTSIALGRSRWMPGGRAIAFVGQDESGAAGVFVQDFEPGRDTDATRRAIGGFAEEAAVESFDILPDGRRLLVSAWVQVFSLMEGHALQGIGSERGAPAR